MSAQASTALGVKLIAIAGVALFVFALVSVSVTPLSATQYAVSIQVKDRSSWGSTVTSAYLIGRFTNGTLMFNATATDLPLTIAPGQTANVTFAVFAIRGLTALPSSTPIEVSGHLAFTVGSYPYSTSLSGTYTAGEIRTAIAQLQAAEG